MPLKAKNYDKTHFYKIVCKDLDIKDCYVGHTTDFTTRKYDHKQRCSNPNNGGYNLPVYRFMRENGGWENFEMILIKAEKCENAMEARSKERKYKEELNANLNGNVPARTFKECCETHKEERRVYGIEYRKNNKDKIRERTEKNKDKRKIYNKEYRDNNREKLLEDKKQYYERTKHEKSLKPWTCECGSTICLGAKSKHFKSKKHQQYIQKQSNPQEQ